MLAPKPLTPLSLSEPVTFTGADAAAFLDGLPERLSANEVEALRARVKRAAAVATDRSANDLLH